MRITCVTYLLFVLLVENVISQQYVGDFCTLTSSGRNGQCQLISACPAAIQALQTQNILPQTCGFSVDQPIVCCEGASVPVTPSTVTTRTSTRATPTTRTPTRAPSTGPLKVGDKSKQKCQEYGRYVYAQSAAVGLTGESPSYDSDECALIEVENIVGGEDARPKEFPHMALVGFDGGNNVKIWQCGGSLISDKFVLTAGHCLYLQEYGEPKFVRLGELVLDTNQDDAEPQDFTIRNKFQHPNYRPPSQYNDIALLELDRSAKLHPYVRPACLNTNPTITNRLSIASGWGKIGFIGDVSKSLLKVTLEKFTNAECNNTYRRNIGIRLSQGIVDATQLCAGSRNESKDTCQGDSGGPLQISNAKEVYCTYKIIGVVSFGKACGTANIPGVYTRVSNYIKWIEDIVWP